MQRVQKKIFTKSKIRFVLTVHKTENKVATFGARMTSVSEFWRLTQIDEKIGQLAVHIIPMLPMMC